MQELEKIARKWDKSLESFKGDRSSLIDVATRIADSLDVVAAIMKESHDAKMAAKELKQ